MFLCFYISFRSMNLWYQTMTCTWRRECLMTSKYVTGSQSSSNPFNSLPLQPSICYRDVFLKKNDMGYPVANGILWICWSSTKSLSLQLYCATRCFSTIYTLGAENQLHAWLIFTPFHLFAIRFFLSQNSLIQYDKTC